jgi:hypothetical protein
MTATRAAAAAPAAPAAAAAHLSALDRHQHIVHCHAPVQLAAWHIVIQHLANTQQQRQLRHYLYTLGG